MARVIFWDVDTQYDFMHADGKLYVPDAEQIIPNLKRLTDYAHDHGIRIVASADDHVAGHPEISDAPDWQSTFRADARALGDRVRAHRGDVLFHKHRFDVFTNENVTAVLEVLAPEDIVLYGVATDVCDKAAVEGLLERLPHARLFVVTDAVKGIDKDVSAQLLKDWGDEGVRLIKTKEVVEEGLVEALARATA